MEILQYQFFQNALWACLLSAIVCGLVGAYIVVRRIVFVSGGITHASFAGLGFGVYTGLNPIAMAAVAAVLSALGISKLSRASNVREDSAIAAIWALGMALGILFLTLTPGYTTGLSSYLFGNILLVTRTDLLLLGAFTLVLVAVIVGGYKPILFSMFDADFAHTRGLNASRWNMAMLILVSIALVLSIRLVGIMLLISLLTLPQNIVGLYTSDLKRLMVGSVGVSLIANVAGLLLSYYVLPVPSGVLIILLLSVAFVIARAIHHLAGRGAELFGYFRLRCTREPDI